jgi:DNA polymerase-3 subunit delta
MTPKQFLQNARKSPLAAGYLFLGNELFYRDRCRQALLQAVLGEDAQPGHEGLTEFDLAEQPLSRLLDDARTFSLFADKRLIVGSNAEAALPRNVAASSPDTDALVRYFEKPAPGVVILLESTRYDWSDRDDKARLERMEKFFSAVPETVKFERFTAGEALAAAQVLARRLNLAIEPEVLTELVEMLGNDVARLSNDLEKIALYAGGGQEVTRADIELLVPEARQRGMFEFSDALARKDRQRALEVLDTLALSGEHWPIQLSLLAGLFRQALAAKEQRARSVQDVMRIFNQYGIRIWPARAKQIVDIARQFSQTELERAVEAMFGADRDLRRERPDDRVIMEQLVVNLTA